MLLPLRHRLKLFEACIALLRIFVTLGAHDLMLNHTVHTNNKYKESRVSLPLCDQLLKLAICLIYSLGKKKRKAPLVFPMTSLVNVLLFGHLLPKNLNFINLSL